MPTRRDFVKLGSLSGAALVVGLRLEEVEAANPAVSSFRPNAWIEVGADDSVTLTVARCEKGQGVRTVLPMILAEELDVDLARVRLFQALPGPDFKDMGTGGSDSVASGWKPLRKAGAAAREMLVAAAAQTWKVGPATCKTDHGAVHHPETGRRLTYGALAAAASKLPVPAEPQVKMADEYRIVGQPTRRLDGPSIVGGSAVYGLDVRLPGMLYATILRPPTIGGQIGEWDARAARQVRGVRQVVQVSTGIAVVADDVWAALKGREALRASWKEEPEPRFSSPSFQKRLEGAAGRKGVDTRREGDALQAIAAAPRRLEALYSYSFQTHAAIEPMNYTADVGEGRCVLWGGTQNPQRVQASVGRLLGIPADKVEVHVTLIGGAFGRRLMDDYAIEAAEVSRAVAAPVQVVWTRADDMKHGHFHPASLHSMAAGIDAAGRPVGWFHRKVGSFLSVFYPSPEELKDPAFYQDDCWGQYDVPYAFPAILTDYTVVECPVRTGPWRAVYSPPCSFARESFLDEIAHAAKRDPLELRLSLLAAPPILKVGRLTIDRGRYRRVLELAAQKAGWAAPLPRRQGRRSGRGIAGNVYDGSTHVAYVADVSVGAQGDLVVHRLVCAVDCGRPLNPLGIEAQIESGAIFGLSAALKAEITFEDGRVQQSTYRDYPVMRLGDAPEIEVHVVPGDERPFGLGEPPVPPVAPAVMNAVFAATGRRVRRLPLQANDLA
jgi:isoquinoline 1-oxidoreductase beta subunit